MRVAACPRFHGDAAAPPSGFLPYLWLYDGCPARGATLLTSSDETPAEAVRRNRFHWVAQSARALLMFGLKQRLYSLSLSPLLSSLSSALSLSMHCPFLPPMWFLCSWPLVTPLLLGRG